MKHLIILIAAFSLSGCFYQSVNQYDLQDAIKICGGIENIANMNSSFLGDETVTCMNSRKYFLHKEK